MRVLMTWGSKRGGTEGIARIIAEQLAADGVEVDLLAPGAARRARGFDAVIVGGGLYANRWHGAARRFVSARERDLQRVPVWFFSSGPLDDSADRLVIPPVGQVQVLMERVGAQGHVTFGGMLAPDARGFPASAMARKRAGDWRHAARIRQWASQVARALPTARPGAVVAQPARAWARLVTHGLAGAALCAVTRSLLQAVTPPGVALALQVVVAPVLFGLVARRYFSAHGARDALPTALAFFGLAAGLDLAVAGLTLRSFAVFTSVIGIWLPLLLSFAATWLTGLLLSTKPWRQRPAAGHPH